MGTVTKLALTFFTMIGIILVLIGLVCAILFITKWLDNKISDKPTPKWLEKFDRIMEITLSIFILSLFLIALFFGIYQTMWQ